MTIGIVAGTAFEDPDALLAQARRQEVAADGAVIPCFTGTLIGTDIPAVYVRRHGDGHGLPPHLVPYAVHAGLMQSLGVQCVLGTAICGSLRQDLPPGSVIVPDQVVDLTGRPALEAIQSDWMHLPFGEPYCPAMRFAAADTEATNGSRPEPAGCVATIAGPRFASRAEARWLAAQGWDLVNMTQASEAYAFRQAGLCYAAIAFVTDYAYGLDFEGDAVIDNSMDGTLAVFRGITRTGPEHIIRICRAITSEPAAPCRCRRPMPIEFYKEPQSYEGQDAPPVCLADREPTNAGP